MLWYFILFVLLSSEVLANLSSENRLFDTNLYEEALDPLVCEQQLSYMTTENTFLRNRFLDAGIRFPRGFFEGNSVDFGNYYQCLGINEDFQETTIQGKYCFINVFLNVGSSILTERNSSYSDTWYSKLHDIDEESWEEILEYRHLQNDFKTTFGQRDDDEDPENIRTLLLRVALCVPKTCTTREGLDEFLPFSLTTLGFSHEVEFCRLPNDKRWVPADYVAISIFSLIGLLTIVSTSYDVYNIVIKEKDPKQVSILGRAFSIYTNAKTLLTFKSKPGSLQCLDGIRSLGMAWILIGHTFVVPIYTLPMVNWGYIMEWSSKYRALFVMAAPISVDTFFMLGGLLVIYTTAGKLDSRGLIKNVHLFYLNRLLRMFPILAAAVLLEASLFNHVTDGPYLLSLVGRTNNCRNNWWTTLLYVQNYVNPMDQCLGHTWYLDIDIQLHILLPLVLFWVLRGKKEAWIAMTSALLLSLTGATIYNFYNNFPGGTWVPSRFGDTRLYMERYYFNTLTRAPPFFVGLFFGYLLHIFREKKVVIPKYQVVLFWIGSAGLSCWIVSYTYLIVQMDWDNQLLDNIMNSFMRSAWAVCLGWMIFACVHGYGGPLNWFLSLNIWKLPARISFGMYIFHYSLMFLVLSTELQPFHFAVGPSMYRFFADYSLTFMVSLLATVLIDMPFSIIFNVLLRTGVPKVKSSNTEQQESKKGYNNKHNYTLENQKDGPSNLKQALDESRNIKNENPKIISANDEPSMSTNDKPDNKLSEQFKDELKNSNDAQNITNIDTDLNKN